MRMLDVNIGDRKVIYSIPKQDSASKLSLRVILIIAEL